MRLNPFNTTCLEKAAVDNGFDLERGFDGGWLIFGSSHVSLQLWLSVLNESLFLVAFSRSDVFDALAYMDAASINLIPTGAAAARRVSNLQDMYQLVRRAFQLARALPDEPLKAFIDKTADLPRATEAERLVVQRIGQDIFRNRLFDYWEGRCAVTGLEVPELLRASHIKPWAVCESDAERLDVFNGILLAPHFDAAFDSGFITIADDGAVIISDALDPHACHLLGLQEVPLRVNGLAEGHCRYLPLHRERVFRA